MKIKYLLPLSILAMFTTSAMAQTSSSMDHYKSVYKQSLKYGDYIAAANAIYDQWVEDTANALSYKDTLANLYFIRGQYYQTIAMGKEILAKHSDDLRMQELVGASDQSVGNLKEALDFYQRIYAKTHDLYHLYQIASIQFDLARVGECQQTLDQIIADTGSVHQKIQITVAQGQAQNVPYKAAALNIRGVIAKQAKEDDAAKKAFQDALAVDPDFVLAKNNLSAPNTSTGSATNKK
jgi:tetratricopeptide (TPR) repeat protein